MWLPPLPLNSRRTINTFAEISDAPIFSRKMEFNLLAACLNASSAGAIGRSDVMKTVQSFMCSLTMTLSRRRRRSAGANGKVILAHFMSFSIKCVTRADAANAQPNRVPIHRKSVKPGLNFLLSACSTTPANITTDPTMQAVDMSNAGGPSKTAIFTLRVLRFINAEKKPKIPASSRANPSIGSLGLRLGGDAPSFCCLQRRFKITT